MKRTRRIIFLIEVRTNEKIADLKDLIHETLKCSDDTGWERTEIIQIQTNVVQRKTKKAVKK